MVSRFARVIVIFSNLLNEMLPAFFFAAVVAAIVDVVRFAVEILLRKIKHVNFRFITTHKMLYAYIRT